MSADLSPGFSNGDPLLLVFPGRHDTAGNISEIFKDRNQVECPGGRGRHERPPMRDAVLAVKVWLGEH